MIISDGKDGKPAKVSPTPKGVLLQIIGKELIEKMQYRKLKEKKNEQDN